MSMLDHLNSQTPSQKEEQLDLESFIEEFSDLESFTSGWAKFRDGFKDSFRDENSAVKDYERRLNSVEFNKPLSTYPLIMGDNDVANITTHINALKDIPGMVDQLLEFTTLTNKIIDEYASVRGNMFDPISKLTSLNFVQSLSKSIKLKLLPTLTGYTHYINYSVDANGNRTDSLDYAPYGYYTSNWMNTEKVKGEYPQAFFEDNKRYALAALDATRKLIKSVNDNIALYEITFMKITGLSPSATMVTDILYSNWMFVVAMVNFFRSTTAELENFSR